MEPVLIAKLLVSITCVMGLSLLAERISPRIAGILSGYPLGTAIVLYFIGLENGTEFAAAGAVYTLGGLSASLVLLWIYYQVSRRLNDSLAGLLLTSLLAICGFLSTATALHYFAPSLSLPQALLLTVSAIGLFSASFRHIESSTVGSRVRISWRVVLFRALMAALTVVLITGVADVVGPRWAGVLSAFPVTLYPFLLVIHLTYGRQPVHTIIRHYPHGLGALVIYTLSVAWFYPLLGLNSATLLCFALATLYLLLYSLLSGWLRRVKPVASQQSDKCE